MEQQTLTSLISQSIEENNTLDSLANYQEFSYTYQQVGQKISWLHGFFREAGVEKGDKIVVISRNHAHWAITYLATITYGAVIVPLLPEFKPETVQELVNHSEASFLFAGQYVYEKLDKSAMPDLKGTISIEDFHPISFNANIYNEDKTKLLSGILDSKDQEDKITEFENIPNETLAAIIYTSGTTSMSKGVMLNHKSLLENVLFAHRNMPLFSGNKIVSFLPLAHAYGCAFEFLFPFSKGCHINFLSKTPSPQQIIAAFQDVRPNLILTVPLIIEKIYKRQVQPEIEKSIIKTLLNIPLLNNIVKNKIRKKLTGAFGNNFREFIIGGAPFNKEVESFFRKIKFPFTVGYGMTECGPLISYINWKKHKLTGVGKVVDELEIKIDSPEPENTVGEIMVRGTQVMLGYYKNEEVTNQTLIDGWLHTGDLGLQDKDGYIYIKGRSKSMILGPSGQNIYPEEIEAKLNNYHYVLESLIVDQEHKLIAIIVPDMELAKKHKIKESDFEKIFKEHIKHLNKHLPSYSQIAKVEIQEDEFVKTPTRKIKRFLYQK
jgi:long-chain acyl-CoA synthetase